MNKSFTLIEILVVIVVIGVLSALILVGMNSITSSANIAKSQAFANSLDNALLLARVSQWKLDGNVNDSWGTNNGTMYNFSTTPWKNSSECISNQCLEFDGTDSYINVGNSLYLRGGANKRLTYELWIKPYDLVGWQHLLDNGWHILGSFFVSCWNNHFYFCLENSLDVSSCGHFDNVFTANKWFHVVGTYEDVNKKIKTYVNGTKSPIETTATEEVLNYTGNLTIGIWDTRCFNGIIDSISIYNENISFSRIKQNYFLGLNNLYKNRGLTQIEYTQRIVELKSNIVENE